MSSNFQSNSASSNLNLKLPTHTAPAAPAIKSDIKHLAQAAATTSYSALAVPSHDEIARRAYHLYCSTGQQPGQCRQNWLKAEQELLHSQISLLAATPTHLQAAHLAAKPAHA